MCFDLACMHVVLGVYPKNYALRMPLGHPFSCTPCHLPLSFCHADAHELLGMRLLGLLEPK